MSTHISRRRLLALGAALPFMSATAQLVPGVWASAAAAVLPIGASAFVPVPPSRLADTRPDSLVDGYERIDATTVRVQVSGTAGVPIGASAAVLNVTIANSSTANFATVYPAGVSRPEASNINVDLPGQVVPNLVTVQLSATGAVDIFTQNAADVIVDVSGAYVPVTEPVAAGRFVGLATAQRVLDTRDGGAKVAAGATQRVDMASVVPASATAVVLNLTVADATAAGFWTAFASGAAPATTSNVNAAYAGQVTANQAIVPLGTVGDVRGVDVFSMAGGHLVVDVAGYFTGAADAVATDGLFVPSAPTRVLDTRNITRYGRMHAGWVAEFDFAGRAQAQAVVVNLTATQTRAAGFFTAYAARTPRPLSSNVNAVARDQTIANHAIVRASDMGVAVFTQTGGALVIDVAGYFTGLPAAATTAAPDNVPPAGSPLNWRLVVPSAGIDATVVEGTGDPVVNGGNVGHAENSGLVGEDDRHIVLFGNRTTSGEVFRNLHLIQPGNELQVTGADGRSFRYVCVRSDITAPESSAAFAAADQVPSPSLSLVASSRANGQPGALTNYIVVSFALG